MVLPRDGADRWVVHGERPVYASKWVSVEIVDVVPPSGRRREHHVVRMPPVALTVLLDSLGERVLMTWRHRVAPDVWNWELPGGMVETGEDAAVTAARELEEETGYRPSGLTGLISFEPNVGILSSPHHIFLAHDAEYVGAPGEVDEGRFAWVPLADVPALIGQGHLVSSDTLVALLYLRTFRPDR